MWDSILRTIRLPEEVTAFERDYLGRMNLAALRFFLAHLPVFVFIAFFNDTDPLLAFILTSITLVGPIVAYKMLHNPRAVSVVYGVASMLLGGLLVHFGQGPVQIEMHFYFFALLAMLAIFGNPMVIVAAAITVALHHVLLWAYLPASVFNYDAPFWVVGVHALFVVLESTATVFIARSFFDNVIGLEKIVQARTAALNQRNEDMRLVMDHVEQGLFTIGPDMVISKERSAILNTWLGEIPPGTTVPQLLSSCCQEAADAFEMGWDQVLEDFLPLELTLGQLPASFDVAGRHMELEYTPIMDGDKLDKLLVVVTDVTARLEQERLEAEQREVLEVLGRVAKDKVGFLEFLEEARELTDYITNEERPPMAELKRAIHTLKGNTMLFGLHSVATLCHDLESSMEEQQELPSDAAIEQLKEHWRRLGERLSLVLGTGARKVEIEDEEYERILRAVLAGDPYDEIAEMIAAWKMESTAVRLQRVAEHAKGIARRLNKSVVVAQSDHGLRVDPTRWASFWASFVHVVRNALDHGIEAEDERLAAGKAAAGSLKLVTRVANDAFVVSIEDDGRGIDWDAVAAKARAAGLPADTREQLEEALFADGISTKDEVTAFSGRGVGFAAVRSETLARGGQVMIDSISGKGTRIEFRFPASEMAAGFVDEFLAAG